MAKVPGTKPEKMPVPGMESGAGASNLTGGAGAETGGRAGRRGAERDQRRDEAMASTASGPDGPSSAAPRAPSKDALLDAFMRLAAERDWSEIDLTDVAREAGVSLAALRREVPSTGALLGYFARKIDLAVLDGMEAPGSGAEDLAGEPAKERLFDVLMRRLDALTPYRTALRRLMPGLRRDPSVFLPLAGVAINSHRFMLAAAGIETSGALGALRVQGCAALFQRVLDTWLEDDDPGLARTMAVLDRELDRGASAMRLAQDVSRLTAPFRGMVRALTERRRPRRTRSADDDGWGDGRRGRPGTDDELVAI